MCYDCCHVWNHETRVPGLTSRGTIFPGVSMIFLILCRVCPSGPCPHRVADLNLEAAEDCPCVHGALSQRPSPPSSGWPTVANFCREIMKNKRRSMGTHDILNGQS